MLQVTETYTQFAVVLDGLLVIFLHVIGEIIDRDIVVLDVLHDLSMHEHNPGCKLN